MKKILFVLLAGLMLVSCGKTEVKKESPESKLTQEAFRLAETVKDAFIVKDTITLRKNSTEAGYRDITANTRGYDRVELSFKPRWVEIDGDQLQMNISWTSKWMMSGRATEERGMAVFLMEGTPLKVSKILRGNPFLVPEQQ